MSRQGNKLSEREVEVIVRLLRETELTIDKISYRTGVSSGAIIAVNKRLKIRIYDGKRATWKTNGE